MRLKARVGGDAAELRTDGAVGIPEEAHARAAVGNTLQRFIVRVGGDAKKGGVRVVKPLGTLAQQRQYLRRARIGGRPEQAQHHIPTRGSMERETLVA